MILGRLPESMRTWASGQRAPSAGQHAPSAGQGVALASADQTDQSAEEDEEEALARAAAEEAEYEAALAAGFEEIIKTVAGGKGQIAYDSGDPDGALIACGQIAGLIDEIKPVRRVIEDMITEAGLLLDRLNGLVLN